MYKVGNKLIWVLVILLGGFVGACDPLRMTVSLNQARDQARSR